MAVETPDLQHPSEMPDDDRLRHLIHEAAEPVAYFWPMSRFVHHNPIHGLEHLPFDRAVREARHLLGGHGYLSNAEYRKACQVGRISEASLAQAFDRVGPPAPASPSIRCGDRRVDASEVWRTHLLVGVGPLEPMLLPWTLGAGGALGHPQGDLPAEAGRRLRQRASAAGGVAAYLRDLWDSAVEAGRLDSAPTPDAPPPPIDLPGGRTVADWLDQRAGTDLVEAINDQLIKWVAAFLDEGMAGWAMPGRADGLYRAWCALAPADLSIRFLGVAGAAEKIRALPPRAAEAIPLLLLRLGVPEARWTEYLSRHLAQLPGWAGLVRWLGDTPTYPGQAGHPASLDDYLAIRLFYEVELVDATSRRRWAVRGAIAPLAAQFAAETEPTEAPTSAPHDHAADDACTRGWPLFRLAQHLDLGPNEVRALSRNDVDAMLGWLAAFPEDGHGQVWLEAYEDTYRRALLGTLAAGRRAGRQDIARPRAQLVLCIDVRSESFRRHIEAMGSYETFGYAGFFGVAMAHAAFDSGERFPLCPVLLTPQHGVDEVVRADQEHPLQAYASGSRWRQLGTHLFHDVKQHPLASLMLVDALGFFFGVGLVGKTLAPARYASFVETVRGWFRHQVGTRVAVARAAPPAEARALGFTTVEQAGIVEGGLRAIGLTEGFGRLVVLCGHGSESDNNPYFGALHCGACGGKHGDANARAFATMANDPEVRALLRSRGVAVPDDTRFLAAKHITTSDRVLFYDVDALAETHRDEWRALERDLMRAGAAQALERGARLPRSGVSASADDAYRRVAERTVDWANVRPEWGLSSNAAFVIARRSLTRGVNLQGRTFLHSYDPTRDPEGAILERIMMAPLIVGQWINMEHYFSSVDPWVWGSGSKVIHNVVAGVGVMLGSQSDLQTGLPLQTVNNGAVHHHEPMRLLTVIEAPPARISAVIAKHALLQTLLHNGWLNLVAVEPEEGAAHRYTTAGAWEAAS